jgi:hypothetical protein
MGHLVLSACVIRTPALVGEKMLGTFTMLATRADNRDR